MLKRLPSSMLPCVCSRVRVHLGIRGLKGAKIGIQGEWRRWTRGRTIAFDDSYAHQVDSTADVLLNMLQVHHTGNASRLVLIVDIWNPGLNRTHQQQVALCSLPSVAQSVCR